MTSSFDSSSPFDKSVADSDSSVWIPPKSSSTSSSSSTHRRRHDIATKLSRLDTWILERLQFHRVLTTSQIVRLANVPERTVQYRLSRLHRADIVGRTRPYADQGSAPFFWWLTGSGALLAEGTSPAKGKATPNPLFLAHASATAAFYIELDRVGHEVGLTPSLWLRDEQAWEEWHVDTLRNGGHHKLRPDALVEFDASQLRAFIEIDLGTMDQGRLASKVVRHVAYEESGPWMERHGHCPALLLLTTSDARARGFLKRAEKPLRINARSPFRNNQSPAVVAACGSVRNPIDAVMQRVWQIVGETELVTLTEVVALTADRRDQAMEEKRQADQARLETDFHLTLREIQRHIAGSGGGRLAVMADIYATFSHGDESQWALQHQELVWATGEWLKSGGAPPVNVVSLWNSAADVIWRKQVRQVLEVANTDEREDPRLSEAVQLLRQGRLFAADALRFYPRLDISQKRAEAASDYARKSEQGIAAMRQQLPLHRRLRTTDEELQAAYDADHLVICQRCGIARHDQAKVVKCPACEGALVSHHKFIPLSSLDDELRYLEEMKQRPRWPSSSK